MYNGNTSDIHKQSGSIGSAHVIAGGLQVGNSISTELNVTGIQTSSLATLAINGADADNILLQIEVTSIKVTFKAKWVHSPINLA